MVILTAHRTIESFGGCGGEDKCVCVYCVRCWAGNTQAALECVKAMNPSPKLPDAPLPVLSRWIVSRLATPASISRRQQQPEKGAGKGVLHRLEGGLS